MEFRFNVNELLKQPIVEINQSLIPPGFTGDRRGLWDAVGKVTEIVNSIGEASASAQGLTKPITTADRLRNSEHKLFLLIDPGAQNGKGVVTGMLKTGKKSLYVFDRDGHHYQVQPPCILDFYVHESRQRAGLGKQLFEHMLQKESIEPVKLAIDRPSDKFLGFLNKHYTLNNGIKQMNNFVVFDGFFPERLDKGAEADNNNSSTPVKNKESANGLQNSYSSPYGRYGAPRPPCSMGQIIHNQSSTVMQPTEPTGVSLSIRPQFNASRQVGANRFEAEPSKSRVDVTSSKDQQQVLQNASQYSEQNQLYPQQYSHNVTNSTPSRLISQPVATYPSSRAEMQNINQPVQYTQSNIPQQTAQYQPYGQNQSAVNQTSIPNQLSQQFLPPIQQEIVPQNTHPQSTLNQPQKLGQQQNVQLQQSIQNQRETLPVANQQYSEHRQAIQPQQQPQTIQQYREMQPQSPSQQQQPIQLQSSVQQQPIQLQPSVQQLPVHLQQPLVQQQLPQPIVQQQLPRPIVRQQSSVQLQPLAHQKIQSIPQQNSPAQYQQQHGQNQQYTHTQEQPIQHQQNLAQQQQQHVRRQQEPPQYQQQYAEQQQYIQQQQQQQSVGNQQQYIQHQPQQPSQHQQQQLTRYEQYAQLQQQQRVQLPQMRPEQYTQNQQSRFPRDAVSGTASQMHTIQSAHQNHEAAPQRSQHIMNSSNGIQDTTNIPYSLPIQNARPQWNNDVPATKIGNKQPYHYFDGNTQTMHLSEPVEIPKYSYNNQQESNETRPPNASGDMQPIQTAAATNQPIYTEMIQQRYDTPVQNPSPKPVSQIRTKQIHEQPSTELPQPSVVQHQQVNEHAKLERPNSLSIQQNEELENEIAAVNKDVERKDEIDGAVDDTENEADVPPIVSEISAKLAEVSVGKGEDKSPSKKTPSHLTEQGFFDLKFYHNKLW